MPGASRIPLLWELIENCGEMVDLAKKNETINKDGFIRGDMIRNRDFYLATFDKMEYTIFLVWLLTC